MCGIVGFLDKSGNRQAAVGQTLLAMLSALDRRGPDSSGVARLCRPWRRRLRPADQAGRARAV